MWEVVCPVHGVHHVDQKNGADSLQNQSAAIAPLYPSYPTMRKTARERSSDPTKIKRQNEQAVRTVDKYVI
jgi:hypothetical protein